MALHTRVRPSSLHSQSLTSGSFHKPLILIHQTTDRMKTTITENGGSEVKASACNTGDLGSILGWEDPLEKEMATHSSTLVCRIPWTEEPGGLQFMGSQRVRHN